MSGRRVAGLESVRTAYASTRRGGSMGLKLHTSATTAGGAAATAGTTRIVVLGGGFAGVTVTRRLERLCGGRADVEITLVSRDNAFVLTPLLFEACSGRLELRHCAQP